MWEALVIVAVVADASAETNWKHKVTPDWGELITFEKVIGCIIVGILSCRWNYKNSQVERPNNIADHC